VRGVPKRHPVRSAFLGIILAAVLAAGVGLLLFPTFADALAGYKQTQVIGGYETAADASAADLAKEREAAASYNAEIAKEQETQMFSYRGSRATDSTYESVLNPGGDGIMAYIEIPKIGVMLPVTHGTKSDELDYEAGHMYGTSVPVGGTDTNAVIAGHTGLPNAKLFTDLTDLTEGDVFYIHVLGEVHVYTVTAIHTVLPEDEMPYLQVQKGQDLVTLYTCTPYGINDHRLIVTGTRTMPDKDESSSGADTKTVETRNRKELALAIFLAAIPAAVLILGIIVSVRNARKQAGPKQDPKGNPKEIPERKPEGAPKETPEETPEEEPEEKPDGTPEDGAGGRPKDRAVGESGRPGQKTEAETSLSTDSPKSGG